MSERLLDVENEAMLKIVELEKQLMQTNKELDQLRVSNVTIKDTQFKKDGCELRWIRHWYQTVLASPLANSSPIHCAGGVCQRQLSGAHLTPDGSGEGPDYQKAEPPGAPGSGGPAGWRTWRSSASERRGRWGCG